ncbi:MAG: T9SS type A sorting domain-containing protein [Bacteroidota bacterium]|nr:T9SS type A sorting domain-containing protein [Bacteroidota bacterium]
MKKITLLVTLAGCLSLQAFSQVVNNVDPSTLSRNSHIEAKAAKTAMTFTNPSSGVQINNSVNKGGIPSGAVAYVDDFSQPSDTNGLKARGYLPYYRGAGAMGTTAAWFQGNIANWPDFNNGSGEYVSSNFNSVTGTNNIDNWLVLPALDVAIGDVISFYSRSPQASTFPDSIRVMYSAVGDSTPEATTWVQLANFKVNTTGAWLQDQFIAPSAGTTARFAIRYAVVGGGPSGNNSDLIGIDQLEVFTPAAFDVEAVSVAALNNEYTRIPLSQVTGATLSGSVKNNGLNATSGGSALFEVVDTVAATVVFSESVTLPSINPGSTSVVTTTGSFTPATIANLRARVTLTYPGDANSANDISQSIVTAITDSVFARDNNATTGSLGIGAGPADGIVGQNFEVSNATDLTSVSFFLTDAFDPNPAGSPVYATIHAQPVGGTPSLTILATTTTLNVLPGTIATGGQWFTLPIDGASLALTPGQYYVGIHEVDSIVPLGTTNQIVTPGTVYVSWNSIPTPPAVNGWATAEDFGFAVTYNLRINFGTPTGINEVNANSTLVGVYPSPATSELTITLDKTISNANIAIYNSLGMLVKIINNVNTNTKVDVSAFAKGNYSVKVTSSGKEYTQRFSVIK